MKKNVWILNHYAGNMIFDKGGRHYCFAKYLNREGYKPVIFCANTRHGIKEQWVESDSLWTEKKAEDINTPFIFVKSTFYSENGKERIKNMFVFFKNVKTAATEYAEKYGKPDIILASSVHPLVLVAGIQLAKKFGVKCICEIRDLWPESLIAYGMIKRNSIIAKFLYSGEKWIYKKADRVIMTWPGGYDYILDRGWGNIIPKEKVIHISNGVDLEEYRDNLSKFPYYDEMFSECKVVKFVYTGSIRKVNNLAEIIKAVEILRERDVLNFKVFIFGSGDEKDELELIVDEKGLDNIVFMGRVQKNEIPSVLSQADFTILHNSSTSLNKYGQSQNKFFEYLASGRPILMTYSVGHSIIRDENCGIEVEHQDPISIADAMNTICSLSADEVGNYQRNSMRVVDKFDFKLLTGHLIELIESI